MFLLIVLTVVGLAVLWYAGVRLLDYLLRHRVRKYFDRKLADLVKEVEEAKRRELVTRLLTADMPEVEEEEKKREGEK